VVTGTVRRAYVLDDEPGVRAVVCRALAANGFDAVEFSTTVPFLTQLRINPPELVVLDLVLGQSDAVEIINHLESLKYAGRILLISGRGEVALKEIQQIGKSHGLAMLPPLAKPFRASELRERLNAAAELRGAAPAVQDVDEPVLDLSEALEKNWLELWYQPKIDLKSLTVCGAEALIRAKHPEHGIVPPAGLLPPTDDPLYQPLTRFVIERAMADWRHFADQQMPLKLAINLPVSVIYAPDFVGFLRELLPKDPRFPGLFAEIKEDDISREPEWVREVATQLKLYNVQISIDDFGSAYSSLSRLLNLPCAEVKLDRTFISNCSWDRHKQTLCRTVVDLAHSFGVTTCAEGVENIQDLRALIDMGCDSAQGFLFAKPMERQAFVQKLRKRADKAGDRAMRSALGVAEVA
jgi:EAL domain-containing protein (putative c-di-GMP-specific phosphodiesterase class I)/ActR/RegA family two-component response regulator